MIDIDGFGLALHARTLSSIKRAFGSVRATGYTFFQPVQRLPSTAQAVRPVTVGDLRVESVRTFVKRRAALMVAYPASIICQGLLHRTNLALISLVAVSTFLVSFGLSAQQLPTPTPEQMQLLNSLPPAQRQELMRQYQDLQSTLGQQSLGGLGALGGVPGEGLSQRSSSTLRCPKTA
jgi:hypothetical protein